MAERRNVAVQLVLYRMEPTAVRRTVESVLASATVARDRGSVADVEVLIGDCSDEPCLTPDDLNALVDMADDTNAPLRYRPFGENLGSAGGSNRLAALSASDLLFVLNPDTYLHPEALHRLVTAVEPGVGIAEGRQLPLEHPKEYDPERGDTPWATGACMLLPRSVFDEVGGFDDEHFFLQCDDVDLSWRVKAAGHRVVHVPRALVLHDKRLDHAGRVVAPAVERFHSTLGRLLLYARYDQPDLRDQYIETITDDPDDPRRRAVEEYLAREQDRRVPAPLPAEIIDRVATFDGFQFARHRW